MTDQKPDILVVAPASAAAAMDRLEQAFTCHHLWRVAEDERAAYLASVAVRISGVFTTAMIGVTAHQVAQLPALRIVAVHGIGIDAIALDATRARGIHVTNTPGVLTDDVADLAVGLLLASARGIATLDRAIRAGAWEAGTAPLSLARSVRGKVAGFFGYGRIGQAIGLRLEAFGMTLRYCQRSAVENTRASRSASLLALAEESDYLILCAPATAQTHGVVDAAVLAALGPQGTLVNIARGSLVDEAALVAALEGGQLGAAALDVFADEPRVPSALCKLDNVVMTPHIGSLTEETRLAMGNLAIDNLLAYFEGRPLLTEVA